MEDSNNLLNRKTKYPKQDEDTNELSKIKTNIISKDLNNPLINKFNFNSLFIYDRSI